MKSIYINILAIFLVANMLAQKTDKPIDTNHSLIEVIANPNSFDEKVITVSGFLILDKSKEGVLFISETDYKFNINKNGLLIHFRRDFLDKNIIDFDKKYVTISGYFNQYNKGFGAVCSGLIYDVRNVIILEENK